eukprot:jgi/Chrzof1/2980/Cz12g06240.t1
MFSHYPVMLTGANVVSIGANVVSIGANVATTGVTVVSITGAPATTTAAGGIVAKLAAAMDGLGDATAARPGDTGTVATPGTGTFMCSADGDASGTGPTGGQGGRPHVMAQ